MLARRLCVQTEGPKEIRHTDADIVVVSEGAHGTIEGWGGTAPSADVLEVGFVAGERVGRVAGGGGRGGSELGVEGGEQVRWRDRGGHGYMIL